jgi:fibronectin-binding autotransporter adhesin
MFGPHVRGWRLSGDPIPGVSFLAYGTHKYGANVALGDLDGDGFDEIVTGAGPGAVFGPHVRAFDYDGSPPVTPLAGVSFLAYGTHKWGVNVEAGDIDGDGYDEIVTGAGPGAVFGPHVRGWNVDGGSAQAMPQVSFFAYGTHRFGVEVTCGDVDGDGSDEIVTGPGPGSIFGAHVRGWNYDGTSVSPLPGFSFFAWPPSEVHYGASVFAGADLNNDGRDDLLVGRGPDPDAASLAKAYHYEGGQVTEWFSLDAFPDLTFGANVAAGEY